MSENTPPSSNSTLDRINRFIVGSVTVRLLSIAFLVLILLIPSAMISDLIRERKYRLTDAIEEVSSKWGDEQTIAGPVITIPYTTYTSRKDKDGNVKDVVSHTHYAHFLPSELTVAGQVAPKPLHRGIYNVVVYESKTHFEGEFEAPDFSKWQIPNKDVQWKNAFVSIGIPDMRGIKDDIKISWNNDRFSLNPGIETDQVIQTGVSVRVPFENPDVTKNEAGYEFSFDIDLNGSRSLSFIPLGRITNVHLSSDWTDPSFFGEFLPDTRDIRDDGFTSTWKILHLNRNYPQQWKGEGTNIYESAFGVSLLQGVDEYHKSERTAKYAIMFIALTFMIFFFVEIMNKKRIHPIQYILVGLALCLFYALLISLSEHIPFAYAYAIGSIAVITLITGYAKTMFKSSKLTALLGGVLVTLYGFIYSIIQLQDLALLMGSIGLFIILAVVMYLSRKIDWYNLAAPKAELAIE